MKVPFSAARTVVLCLLVSGKLIAQPSPARLLAVRPSHPVTVHSRIQAYASAGYTVTAEAGQQLHVSLHASRGAPLFNIYAPGTGPGDHALFRGEVDGSAATLHLATSGLYRVQVYQMRSAERRGRVADFTLTLTLLP